MSTSHDNDTSEESGEEDLEYIIQDVDVGNEGDADAESAFSPSGANQSEYTNFSIANDEDTDDDDSDYFDAQSLLERLAADYEAQEDAEDDDGDEDYVDEDDDEEDNDDDDDEIITIVGNTFRVRLPSMRSSRGLRTGTGGRRRRERPNQENAELVPSEAGRELMFSGEFGYDEAVLKSPKRKRRASSLASPQEHGSPSASRSNPTSPSASSTATVPSSKTKIKRPTGFMPKRLLAREMGSYVGERARIAESLMAQSLLPSRTDKIIYYDNRCYSGQFSPDGNFFYSCAQDMRVRIYDTTNPYDWKFMKSVYHHEGRWTLTDACMSQDNRNLAYSSIHSAVYLTTTDTEDESEVTRLDFTAGGRRHSMVPQTGIWSIRFSGDGREIVAGAADTNIYVYDLEVGRPILRLAGHEDDVNAVCYGDISSPHILFSGSDDSTIKIWDRRSMASGKEAGAFVGHMEGLTYVDAKGDGRYVLSNSKDQTMKLWDVRKMMERSQLENITNYSIPNFDYRFMTYDDKPIQRHPSDCSVVTYRGHRVLKTLIRCHFSPPTSSGSRYVYTGSEDGRVHIYNLDATVAGIVDVQKATNNTCPRIPGHQSMSWSTFSSHGMFRGARPEPWKTVVRDVSWHPNAPIIVSTAWNGYGSKAGTLAIHSWNGKAGERKMRKKNDGEQEKKDGEVDDQADDQPERVNEKLKAVTSLNPR